MNPLCSHCLSALPFGWPEIEDCAECAALEAVDTALAAPAGGRAIAIDLPDRATYSTGRRPPGTSCPRPPPRSRTLAAEGGAQLIATARPALRHAPPPPRP